MQNTNFGSYNNERTNRQYQNSQLSQHGLNTFQNENNNRNFASYGNFPHTDRNSNNNMSQSRTFPRRSKTIAEIFKFRKIYITNYPPNTTEQDLSFLFASFGEIEKVNIPSELISNQQKSYCFVTFKDHFSAKQAILGVNGMNYKGGILKVNWAKSKVLGDQLANLYAKNHEGINSENSSFPKYGNLKDNNITNRSNYNTNPNINRYSTNANNNTETNSNLGKSFHSNYSNRNVPSYYSDNNSDHLKLKQGFIGDLYSNPSSTRSQISDSNSNRRMANNIIDTNSTSSIINHNNNNNNNNNNNGNNNSNILNGNEFFNNPNNYDITPDAYFAYINGLNPRSNFRNQNGGSFRREGRFSHPNLGSGYSGHLNYKNNRNGNLYSSKFSKGGSLRFRSRGYYDNRNKYSNSNYKHNSNNRNHSKSRYDYNNYNGRKNNSYNYGYENNLSKEVENKSGSSEWVKKPKGVNYNKGLSAEKLEKNSEGLEKGLLDENENSKVSSAKNSQNSSLNNSISNDGNNNNENVKEENSNIDNEETNNINITEFYTTDSKIKISDAIGEINNNNINDSDFNGNKNNENKNEDESHKENTEERICIGEDIFSNSKLNSVSQTNFNFLNKENEDSVYRTIEEKRE